MNTYMVILTVDPYEDDAPFCFICKADNFEHAEEQCVNAYPDYRTILWVANCTNPDYSDEGKWVG